MSSDNKHEEKHSCASESSSESRPKINYEETFKREADASRGKANGPIVEGVGTSEMRVEIAEPPFWMKSNSGLEVKKHSVKAHPWMKENKQCKLSPGVLREVIVTDPTIRKDALE